MQLLFSTFSEGFSQHSGGYKQGLWRYLSLPGALLCPKEREKNISVNCIFTGLLKWKLANEVRQFGSLRIETVSNCDLKYAHNPIIDRAGVSSEP